MHERAEAEAAEQEAKYRWSLEHPDAGDYGSGGGGGGSSYSEPTTTAPRIRKTLEKTEEDEENLCNSACRFYDDGMCRYYDNWDVSDYLRECRYSWDCTKCSIFQRR